MTAFAEMLLTILAAHIGRDNAASVEQLRQELAAAGAERDARNIRKTVESLRSDGHHICAHPAHGYWIAANDAELQQSCAFLRSRAMCSLQQEAAMRRVSLPALLGQLTLEI